MDAFISTSTRLRLAPPGPTAGPGARALDNDSHTTPSTPSPSWGAASETERALAQLARLARDAGSRDVPEAWCARMLARLDARPG